MATLLFILAVVGGAFALAMNRAAAWQWAAAIAAATFAWQTGLVHGQLHFPHPGFRGRLVWLIPAALAALSVPEIRRKALVEPAFRMVKGLLPKVSATEQQALKAGNVGFDAELFSGTPGWTKLRAIAPIVLTPEGQAF